VRDQEILIFVLVAPVVGDTSMNAQQIDSIEKANIKVFKV
jgi:hypothetical protein